MGLQEMIRERISMDRRRLSHYDKLASSSVDGRLNRDFFEKDVWEDPAQRPYDYTAWSEILQRNTVSYGIINVRTHQKVADHLSTAPEMSKIRLPYGIIVNPINKDFYIMDAKNYVSSGELLHFLPDGTFDWSVRTGDIPAHAVFISGKRLPY